MYKLCEDTANNLRYPDYIFWTAEYFSWGFPTGSYFEIITPGPPLKACRL
jgi:hypothetical protein